MRYKSFLQGLSFKVHYSTLIVILYNKWQGVLLLSTEFMNKTPSPACVKHWWRRFTEAFGYRIPFLWLHSHSSVHSDNSVLLSQGNKGYSDAWFHFRLHCCNSRVAPRKPSFTAVWKSVQERVWSKGCSDNVSIKVFCPAEWVRADAVKNQRPGWHCRIPIKKVKQTGLTQYLSKCKELPGPSGLHTMRADLRPLTVMGARTVTRSSEGRGRAARGLPSHPPPFPEEPALETLVKCMWPWIIQPSHKHKPQNKPGVCTQLHSKGSEYCLEFIARC